MFVEETPVYTSRANVLASFIYRLPSIIVSRFLLNLQAVDQKSTGMVSSTGSGVESVLFQRVIGSLGGEIEFGVDDDVDGTEEYGIRGEGGGVGDIRNSLSGIERTQGDDVEAVVKDD